MGRTYAGILGTVSFSTVLVRGLIDGGGVESTLLTACACLFVFAALGAVVGRTAAWVVDESVRAKVNAELDALQAAQGTTDAAARAPRGSSTA